MTLIRGSEAQHYVLWRNTMIAKHILRAVHAMGLMAGMSIIWIANVNGQSIHPPIGTQLPEPQQVVTSFELHAINDPTTGKGAFVFEGHEVPPVIRAVPGGKIQLEYVNQMSKSSSEVCVDGACMNMTNLHFHGLHVSPEAPGDDVLTMMAMPGELLHYTVDLPADQPPGLYWYHTHPHGESYRQNLDGMSGAIVIDGMDRYFPEIKNMKERILILRDAELEQGDPSSTILKTAVQLAPYGCGAATGEATRVFTVNGVVRPKIAIASGEKQFWRIVNASPDLYADLELDSESMTVVALDGMPLTYHDPKRHTEEFRHVLLAPGGRAEVIVIGPKPDRTTSLRSMCVNTGADGDPNPDMVLADLDTNAKESALPHSVQAGPYDKAIYKPLPNRIRVRVERSVPDFTVKFSEDKKGFYINDRKFAPDEEPMTRVKVGTYAHWRVTNATNEIHPFHTHQVHFLVYERTGVRLRRPEWMDTVNLEPNESLDLIMDFTDPIIRGVSVFHCHLLSHEDKGMMAKILFE
jgi:FtsP/CotA-like multicopper oxidase with cupredoxin domain